MSDEDWFNKDEDELVGELKLKTSENTSCQEAGTGTVERIEVPKEKLTREIKIHKNVDAHHPNRIDTSVLQNLLKKDPLELFLYIATKTDDSYDVVLSYQIVKTDSQKRVISYIQLLCIIYELKLEGFMDEILILFSKNDVLMDILSCLLPKLFDKHYVTSWKDMKINELFIENLQCLLLHSYHGNYLTEKGITLLETIHKAMNICNRDDLKETFCFKELSCILHKLFGNCENKIDKKDYLLEVIHKDKDILPSLEEILGNNKESALESDSIDIQNSVILYVKKQMLMLREDFMIGLRERVKELRNGVNLSAEANKTVWKNTRIVLNSRFLSEKRHELLFVDLLGSSRRPYSTLLTQQIEDLSNIKTGSLLCFTTSLDFDNLILATVTYTDKYVLKKGFIGIEMKSQQHIGNIYNIDFIMFESPTFFEPYNNVYNYLKNCSIKDFPMRNYIVNGEKSSLPPKYLENSTIINLGKQKWKLLTEDLKHVSGLMLDNSQIHAFKHALTNDMSIIQGPPGTGKTHVSEQIVKTLLANREIYKIEKTPIILITYTNESLDKFLLKISDDLSTPILRFGSQSRIPEIKKYNASPVVDTFLVKPQLKRLYFVVKSDFKLKFEKLQKLQKDFDGSEENYQVILKALQDFRVLQQKLDTIRIMFQYYTAKGTSIIAMTTTCAAKMNCLFRFLQSPIVIFEEAAEILECHVLACLTRFIKHIIMIGDHMQLKPYTSNYEHSKTYSLNVSLFERLINQGFKYVALNKQYRMRPIIADLLWPTFYETLHNADKVIEYPLVRGMKQNLYFLTHANREDQSMNQLSIANTKEMELLLVLAEYLIEKYDYKNEDIVILSPYAKQVAHFEDSKTVKKYGIRVSTVDSFQGLEANIILLSLVRNNEGGEIGFLKQKNRICVALSRAKYALYIAGNIDLLALNSNTWKIIKAKLERNQCVGKQFPYLL